MKTFIEKFFKSHTASDSESSDGYSQPQREAIIDLLVFTMYADNHLALSEESLIDKRIEVMDWESSETAEFYLEQAIRKVREMRADKYAREDLFASIKERLDDDATKNKVLGLCQKLIVTDGEVKPAETAFIQELKQALF